jgi:O-antigen/teichoic acid export membrane protein
MNRAPLQHRDPAASAGDRACGPLARGNRLVRSLAWNGAGEVGPLLAAIVAMPILIHRLGLERFGVLALGWTVFGCFSLFDLGLGSALTKLISDRLGERREEEIPPLIWTGLALSAAFGAVGAVLLALFCPLIVGSLLKVPAALQAESRGAFYVLAFALPVVIGANGLTATLAAYQRFDLINLVRSPMAMFISIGPLLVLPFSNSLVPIIAVLSLGHLATCGVYLAMCVRVVPELERGVQVRRALVRPLLGFGGWVAASSVVGLIMTSLDRFMLGAMVSMSAVSFYVVPYRVVAKFRVLPRMVEDVLYPAFAYSLVGDREHATMLFGRGAKFVMLAMFPVVLVAVMFAREALALWVGARFAAQSAAILRWLAVAALMDAIAQLSSSLVAAAHRPDLNAKVHAVELPLYAALMVVMIRAYGAEGAAMAWAIRAAVDAFAHVVAAQWVMPELSGVTARFGWFLLAAVASLGLGALPLGAAARLALVAGPLAGLAALAWLALLDDDDRALLRAVARAARARRPARLAGAAE